MRKDTLHYQTSKVVVDFYSPRPDGSIVCSCYTPGAPTSVEPEYLVKTITYNDLKEHIADGNGKVFVSHSLSDGEFISFDRYLAGLTSRMIENYMAQVINKREFRDHYFSMSVYQPSLINA